MIFIAEFIVSNYKNESFCPFLRRWGSKLKVLECRPRTVNQVLAVSTVNRWTNDIKGDAALNTCKITEFGEHFKRPMDYVQVVHGLKRRILYNSNESFNKGLYLIRFSLLQI